MAPKAKKQEATVFDDLITKAPKITVLEKSGDTIHIWRNRGKSGDTIHISSWQVQTSIRSVALMRPDLRYAPTSRIKHPASRSAAKTPHQLSLAHS